MISINIASTHVEAIGELRDRYRAEMSCQIIHDSLHTRPGWTEEYELAISGERVGYGSVAVAGPWREAPAVYELYIVPSSRVHFFDLAELLLRTSRAPAIEVQSNDGLGLLLLHAFGRDVNTESILFEDAATTEHVVDGAVWRHPTPDEAPELADDDRVWRGLVEIEGEVAASGGVMFHYNPPYADIYMEVAEPFRCRGLGTMVVERLKRLCREHGFIPSARCNPGNAASRRTLQRAGFAPCGHLLHGRVSLP